MKSEFHKETTVTLILDDDEAIWLKGLVQNPISPADGCHAESKKDKKMREAFWEALSGTDLV